MKILFTFPGQGTQRAGMLQHLPDGDALLNSVRAVLGDETDQLDSVDALRHTRAVQLSLLICGVAWARELIRRGVKPDIASGLSIGAFPAAVISGALDFSDALRLVALRGDLMEQAYPEGYGLTAITGLTLSRLEKLMPGSKFADAEGYVMAPDIDPTTEWVNGLQASRAYEANVAAAETMKSMVAQALRLLA